MARLLNTLPEGDLTFSSYDPNSPSFALRASSTIQNILNAVEGKRQRHRDKAIIDAILRGGGIDVPGTPPILPRGIRQVVIGPGGRPIVGTAEGPTPGAIDPNAPPRQSFIGKILSGVGNVFNPNLPPSGISEIEKGLTESILRSQAKQTKTGPSDFQLWQQAQKQALVEAGGTAFVGVEPEQREFLRKRTIEIFNELKGRFSPTGLPQEETTETPTSSESINRQTLPAPKSTFTQTFNPFNVKDEIPFVLNPVTATQSYLDKLKLKNQSQQRMENIRRMYNILRNQGVPAEDAKRKLGIE